MLALMIAVFRILVVMAVASFVIGVALPFDRPFSASVDLNQPPPLSLVVACAFLIVSAFAVVASGALLLFRAWGRWLGIVTGLGALSVAWLAADSPITGSLSLLATVLITVSLVAWLTGLAISYHPAVAPRFRHER